MILLNQIIQILVLPDGHLFLIGFIRDYRGQSGGLSTAFIDSGPLGFPMMTNSLAKEAQCGSGIPFGGQQKIDSLTGSIDRTI